MARTSIEWTEVSWNPFRGCTKISPGCKHCYAEQFAERFRGVVGNAYEQGFDPRFVPEKLDEPLHWRTPRRIFVNSMSDLFHEAFTDEQIVSVFRVMEEAEQHVFQVLTKRPERMETMLRGPLLEFAKLPQLWWGVTVDDRACGLPRLETLRRCDVDLRWLSVEPLLEDLGAVDFYGINWVVVGGESGAHLHDAVVCEARGLVVKDGNAWKPREDRISWVRSLRDQALSDGSAFFFKQWGGPTPKSGGRLLDGRTWDDYPATAVAEVSRV